MLKQTKSPEALKLEELGKGLKNLMKKIDRKKIERMRKAGLILEDIPDRVEWNDGIAILSRRLQQSAQWIDAHSHLKGSPAYKTVMEVRSNDMIMYNFMKRYERGQIEYWTGPASAPKAI